MQDFGAGRWDESLHEVPSGHRPLPEDRRHRGRRQRDLQRGRDPGPAAAVRRGRDSADRRAADRQGGGGRRAGGTGRSGRWLASWRGSGDVDRAVSLAAGRPRAVRDAGRAVGGLGHRPRPGRDPAAGGRSIRRGRRRPSSCSANRPGRAPPTTASWRTSTSRTGRPDEARAVLAGALAAARGGDRHGWSRDSSCTCWPGSPRTMTVTAQRVRPARSWTPSGVVRPG